MSEHWSYRTSPISDHAPRRRPSADEDISDVGLQRQIRYSPSRWRLRDRNRAEGQSYGLILAALGGIGLIVLAFV